MKIHPAFLFLIVAMGLVTYVPRVFPLFCLSRRKLPAWLETWLDFIPAAVLSALIVPALVLRGEPRYPDLFKPELVAALPTFLFALRTRSLGATVVLGMASFWLAAK